MKIVMIGCSGHSFAFCIPQKYDPRLDYVAVAPGSKDESIELTVNLLHERGYNPHIYEDYHEMLSKEKPDLAIVDNYYAEHAPVIMDAFASGCHVMSDKPAARNLQQLDELYNAWKASGKHFAEMFNLRYDGAFFRAYRLIQEGAIGEVRLLNAQKSYKLGQRPAFMHTMETYCGTIPWVGIHGVDWILWMSGKKVVSASALQCASQAENGVCPQTTALVQYELEDGVMASLTVDYLRPAAAPVHGDDRIRVVGTTGVLEVRDSAVTLINENGLQYPENLCEGDLFEDFLLQIEGKGACRVSAEEAFAASRAALCAQQAADENRRIVL